MSVSEREHDGGPGELVEQARVIRSEHLADHARHRQLLAALGRIEALLERLARAAEAAPARGAGAPRSSRGK
jgi:hypothetical protein